MPPEGEPPTEPVAPREGGAQSARAFWIGFALGAPILVLGVRGAIDASHETHPAELARWVLGAALVHDGLALPLIVAAGWLGRRAVPGWAWPAVRWALATTATLVVVSWPFVHRYGAAPGNPSLLDRPYGTGVLVAVLAVWLAAALWAAVDRSRRRS